MPNASELDTIARADVDVKDGDKIILVDAGKFVDFKQKDGSSRTRLSIRIQCAEGQIKELTLNNTTRAALIKGYGKMTEEWVGCTCLASVLSQNVGGEIKKIIYLSPVAGAKKPERKLTMDELQERFPGEEG